jgi:hypothetical protein
VPKEIVVQKWECIQCGKTYDSEEAALKCESTHNDVYVKLSRLELRKLIDFLYVGDPKILPEGLVEKLTKLDRLGI